MGIPPEEIFVSNAITEVVLARRCFPERAAGAPNGCCRLPLIQAR
ncbi:MAG TPA: hypothetical protein VGO04_18875 [Ensifer sp.]|jgi:hypothetical protein|nr:hypothetical protein [Ensifer sp.]